MFKKKKVPTAQKQTASRNDLNKTVPLLAVFLISTIVFFVLIYLFFEAQNGMSIKKPDNYLPIVDPLAYTTEKDIPANLYFRLGDSQYLVVQNREITVGVNESTEMAVLRELIKGPISSGSDIVGLLPEMVEVVHVEQREDTLYVTFDKELLRSSRLEVNQQEVDKKLLLMTKAIVNTMVDLGKATDVQILVREGATGTGERLDASLFGIQDKKGAISPIQYDQSVVLTDEKTLSLIVEAINEKDWEQLYRFVAQRDREGKDKPGFIAAQSKWDDLKVGIKSYEIVGYSIGPSSHDSILRIDVEVISKNVKYQRENMPIVMINQSDIWKISYDALLRLMHDREE